MMQDRSANIIGRLGAPTNRRAGGVMRSATKKKDARLQRRRARLTLRAARFEGEA